LITSIEVLYLGRQENLAPSCLEPLYSHVVKINEWVREARTKAKLSQEKFGELLSCTKGNVSGWENDRHLPSYEQMVLISQITGYPMPGLATDAESGAFAIPGQVSFYKTFGAITPPDLEKDLMVVADQAEDAKQRSEWEREVRAFHASIQKKSSGTAAAESSLTPILSWEHEDDLPPGEFVMIPRLSVQLSAGNGREQIGIEFSKGMPQAFRAEWIREQKLRPNKLAAMTADGESMEPTIFHGDSLLVDTSQDAVTDGKVYALWYDGGERVKRLFRLPGGGLRIQSDNTRHHTIELKPEDVELVRIIGRVVHRSGKGGL
jgi:phage repressor protein C with HTH and peptisase S24 domain/DNA-binding XRE family transcriptional regulator